MTLEDDKTLGSYDIERIQRSSCYLVESNHILLFFKTLANNLFLCWVPPGTLVDVLKQKVEAIEGTPICMTCFSWF